MKIVIAGAGAVGSYLAKLLAHENQDIVLIDENPDKIALLTNSGDLDIMTLGVKPTSISGLKEGGVGHCDLFIAVTPVETCNITSCMIAHALGARKTIARVDSDEYTQPQYGELFQKMGVDSIIYPERLAAREILDGIKRSWVRQYWEVEGGALVMLGIKLRENARIIGIALRDLCSVGTPYHIVVIKRGDDTIIPQGSDGLRQGDIAYFMTTKRHIPYIQELVGKEDYEEVRNVMIMGGGRTSVHVAEEMPDFYNLKIIERSEERCYQLSEILATGDVSVIQGDGRDTSLLLEEGLADMHAFCALTPETETNILACLAAKRMNVRKTVALVDNTDYVSLAEKLDIGTIINKKMIAASRIYQMMLDTDTQNVKCLTIADADVAEIAVEEGSLVSRQQVRDLKLPSGITLGGFVRDGKGDLIYGNTQLQAGDQVVIFCKSGLLGKMDRYFGRPSGNLLERIFP